MGSIQEGGKRRVPGQQGLLLPIERETEIGCNHITKLKYGPDAFNLLQHSYR